VDNWMQMLGSAGAALPVRFRHRHRDGSWRWVEMTNHNFLDDPARAYVTAELLVFDDPVAERAPDGDDRAPAVGRERPLQLHEALLAREQLLHRLSEALPVGVLQVDASGRVLYTNRRLHTIVDEGRTATVLEQLSHVVEEDMPTLREAFDTALRGGLDNDIEVRIAAADAPGTKGVRQCTLSIRTLADEDGQTVGAVACLVDVTESVRMRDELRMQATFDTLTTCYNRASTMEALSKMLADAPERVGPAVIFVDLDGFKNVNDHLGHAAGDQMLEIVARRLQRAVRDGDVVGRIGGDEFLVLCPGIGSAAEAVRAATRVTRSLRAPLKLESAEVSCRASVGVAWSPDRHTAPDTLIGQADAAMYQAKRGDLGRPVLYRHGS
jgi:diguanylate cyclase (GGDEF)-like protein